MHPDRNATVFRVFVAIVAVFLAIDVVLLARGNPLAAIPFIIESAVFWVCLLRLRVAIWIVRIWAALMILTGVAYWISVLFQLIAWAIYPEGGPIGERISKLTIWGSLSRTLVLALGVAILKFVTRDVLRPRSRGTEPVV